MCVASVKIRHLRTVANMFSTHLDLKYGAYNDTQVECEYCQCLTDWLYFCVCLIRSEISGVVEQIESSQRDLSSAELQNNNTRTLMNDSITPLQQNITQFINEVSNQL